MKINIKSNTKGTDYHDNGIQNVTPLYPEKESKVVIIDADMLTHLGSYRGKDELGNNLPDYTLEEYPEAEGKTDEMYLKILNTIEEYFNISAIFICLKSKEENIRKSWYPPYKAHRKESLPLVGHLHNYLVEKYNGIETPGGYEADDLVFSLAKKLNYNCIIVAEDKDLRQMPTTFYNPKKDYWFKVNEEEARYNFAAQLLIGDNADGICIFKGVGEKTAEKVLTKGMTNWQYMRAILTFLKKKGFEDYKNKLKLSYKLLKLHDLNEL